MCKSNVPKKKTKTSREYLIKLQKLSYFYYLIVALIFEK
jgi:hypothetical protein